MFIHARLRLLLFMKKPEVSPHLPYYIFEEIQFVLLENFFLFFQTHQYLLRNSKILIT